VSFDVCVNSIGGFTMFKWFIRAFLTVLLITGLSFAQGEEIVVSFITVNGYSNNLYIDNFTIGNQFMTDVAVLGVNNIKPDTSYSIGSDPYVVTPTITIANVGKTDISTPFDVIMSVTPGSYSSSRTVNSILQGQVQQISFDDLTITPGTENNIEIYSTLNGDENLVNDTLNQYTMILPGVQRNILLEEWTSSTCGPCAANNPTIDAFIGNNFDTVVAIKYHVGWPSPGNDPMYLYNPTQSYDRRYYYGVNAVPTAIMDGVVNPSYPYSDPSSLPNAFNSRISVGSPISVAVTDTHIPGDSIQADIEVTIHAPLQAGDYYLRVNAVERMIDYGTPPGTNGESVFYDVFRHAYPNTQGTTLPTAPGTYNFIFKYHIDTAVWVDSMMYTAAFVQNDLNKDVLNCGKGWIQLVASNNMNPIAFNSNSDKMAKSVASDALSGNFAEFNGENIKFDGTFNFEFFETAFPPPGWRLVNPDAGITFEQYDGANGPSFGGSKSTWIDFYSYGNSGQTDSLFSPIYTGLLSSDSIKFDWAYAQYPGYSDRLLVKVSTDGGASFPYTIFDKEGAALATAGTTTNPFVPVSGQWQSFAYSLETIITGIDAQTQVPSQFKLMHNYPNPFNPETTIRYSLNNARAENTRLIVYNSLGQIVRTLVDAKQPAGEYQVPWDGKNNSGQQVASGIYYYQLTSGEMQSVQKMILIR
jgi:hypothetical protein